MAYATFELIKNASAAFCSMSANNLFAGPTIYLATGALTPTHDIDRIVQSCFQSLHTSQQNRVYEKIWELEKMQDPRISGINWGEQNVFKDTERLAKALHRLGFLDQDVTIRHPVDCLSFSFGEGGLGSQYFSLGEKLDRNPTTGRFGLVNGMGVPTLEHAGRDANNLSDRLLQGYNIHCVYHATHQNAPSGDLLGFAADVVRMKAVDGGSYGKTSYLLAQQWIDYLTVHPHAKFLQMAHSEGAAHVNAALRLLKECRPDLLARVRVITFCPACFIDPNSYSAGLQVRNLVKKEDGVINPWGTGAHQIQTQPPHLIIIPHHHDHPHNHVSEDYINAARPYIGEFLRSGNLHASPLSIEASVEFDAGFGNSLILCGSGGDLSWYPSQGKPLKFYGKSKWAINIPSDVKEFKLVLKTQDGTFKWETLQGNHSFNSMQFPLKPKF
jgi:hypothetical protein